MNNGHPPYGDPSQWGRQPAAGQEPQAQFVPGQADPQSGGYQQQSYGQNPYQQQGYPQPYGQGGYQQGYPSGAYQQPQTYQPQEHQAQESYAQQTWQPYGQQAYPQQGAQQPYGGPQYQQSMQNDQPLQQGQQPVPGMFYPAQGYSGYVSSAKGQSKPNPISGEVIVKVALFGLLPVLFILGVALKSPVLCWLYVAGAVAAIAAMWIKPLVDDRLKLIASLVGGVLGVVAVITALGGLSSGGDQAQAGGSAAGNAGQAGSYNAGVVLETTLTPTVTPTVTPDPYAEASAAVEQLQSFFYLWHVNNDEAMLALCAPSWRNSVSKPLEELFAIRLNRTPMDDCEITMSGSEADSMRTAKVKVSIDKNNGRDPQRYAFNVIMVKEDGVWYVDPRSLESNEKETATTPATNVTPTQPVLNTGAPSLVLYYNPDGGSMYHIDANCDLVHDRYKPLKGQFLFTQLNEALYKNYEPCTVCGAPLRE